MPMDKEITESNTEGLIFGCKLDGKGGCVRISLDDLKDTPSGNELIWLHMNYENEQVQKWLFEESGLDELMCTALLASDPRPRCLTQDNGLFAIVRGVNMNPGADPDDMVSVRMWMQSNFIITLRNRRMFALNDLRIATEKGQGPKDANEFLIQFLERLLSRMEEVVVNLDEQVDVLSEKVISVHSSALRSEISQLRCTALSLRRHISPQRIALNRMVAERLDWFTDFTQANLREYSDLLMRYVEDLDSALDRAAVLHEELNSILSERMNQTMYLISIVTAVFLPLGLLTGLLGINVGGMPGVESAHAFWIVCLLLTIISVILVFYLKVKKWF